MKIEGLRKHISEVNDLYSEELKLRVHIHENTEGNNSAASVHADFSY